MSMKYIQSITLAMLILAMGCNEQTDLSQNVLVLPGSKVEKLADGFTMESLERRMAKC